MPQIAVPNPNTKQITTPNLGELLGTLWATRNVEFDAAKGKVRLSERLYRLFDDTDDADFKTPVKFIRTDADTTERWFALTQTSASAATGNLFKTTNTVPSNGWAQDAIANSPTDAQDNMVIFGKASGYDRLIVAKVNDLAMLNNGTWDNSWWDTTLAQAALGTNPHHIHKFYKILLVPDGNLIHTIDLNLNIVLSRLVLPEEFQVRWINDDGRRVFIGTKNTRNGEAYVFPWDGFSATYDDPMRVYDKISYAGTPLQGVMHIVNGKGQLMADNGIDFKEVAAFPVKDSGRQWKDQLTKLQPVHPNGMKVIHGKIHILVNAQLEGAATFLSNFYSGIWVHDPEIGLYNKYSVSSFKSTNNAWGAAFVTNVGAIEEIGLDEGRLLAGASVVTAIPSSNTSAPSIFTSQGTGTANQRGYFVTTMLSNPGVRNFWKTISILFKALEASTDRIVVKYRTEKDRNFSDIDLPSNILGGTWHTTDSSIFTSTNSELANATAGMEVEILYSYGDGGIAHISTIVESGGTYTVTLDEEIPNVAGSSRIMRFRVMNWKKLGTTSSQSMVKQVYSILKQAPWIQFKVELRGNETSPEIEQLLPEFEPMRF